MHFKPGLYTSRVGLVAAMKDKVRKDLEVHKIEIIGIYIYISVDKILLKNSQSFTWGLIGVYLSKFWFNSFF